MNIGEDEEEVYQTNNGEDKVKRTGEGSVEMGKKSWEIISSDMVDRNQTDWLVL